MQEASMLIYNVFGRYLGVKQTSEGWQVFRADMSERKFSRLYDIIIPDDLTEMKYLVGLGIFFMNQPAKSILMLYVSNDNGVQLPLKFRPKKSPLGAG